MQGEARPGPEADPGRFEDQCGRSGGLGEGFEGDLVAEALELFDEPSAVAFGVLGVAAVEEFFAELVVLDFGRLAEPDGPGLLDRGDFLFVGGAEPSG